MNSSLLANEGERMETINLFKQKCANLCYLGEKRQNLFFFFFLMLGMVKSFRSFFSRLYSECIHESGISAGKNFSRGDKENSAMDRWTNTKTLKYKSTMY